MTALNYQIQNNQICFAIDTLAICVKDREPARFMTKFISLPHISTVITGTGHGEFIDAWMSFVRANMIIQDIDDLNQLGSQSLKWIAKGFPELNETSATIYHFGYSKSKKIYTGYAYRSSNGWSSEQLALNSTGLKPAIKVRLDSSYDLPAKFIEIMKIQQKEDNLRPRSERVGIGGEIQFVHMKDEVVHIMTCHRFSSYESEYEKICARQQL
ncbi:MAG: hypothetical protein COA51_00850 [Idiomarina sp.]|nr:MAG: hypothetical protein COA51_00850 [Idiomarina sp.]